MSYLNDLFYIMSYSGSGVFHSAIDRHSLFTLSLNCNSFRNVVVQKLFPADVDLILSRIEFHQDQLKCVEGNL